MNTKAFTRIRTLSLSSSKNRFLQKHGIGFLNIAQFLGAFNDNLFKFLTTFLLIDLWGKEFSSTVVFWIGIVYILPFLLFSTVAGALADKFSKQKLIVLMKLFEVFIILASFFIYKAKWVLGSYGLVFLLSLQSALMGPAKYSIIPEIVRKDQVFKANSLITSFTYLSIILGTFFASFVTQITMRNFTLATLFCLAVAVIGFIASLYIPPTVAGKHVKKIRLNVFSQVVHTLKYCRKTPTLILAVLGSGFCLFIGAYFQLNIIPFAIDVLNLSEIGGGYLFLCVSVGIALGAYLAGRCSKKGVQLGLSCFALALMPFLCVAMSCMASTVTSCATILFLFGFCGGLYVVPLETFIQYFSPTEMRGQIFATSSFLSFFGVLLAPICLFIFENILRASSATGFLLMGGVILCFFWGMLKFLANEFLHFVAKTFVQPFFELHFIDYPFNPRDNMSKTAVLCPSGCWKSLVILYGEIPKIDLWVVKEKKNFIDKFLSKIRNIHILSEEELHAQETFINKKNRDIRQKVLFFTNKDLYKNYATAYKFSSLRILGYSIQNFSVRNVAHFTPSWKHRFKHAQITFKFSHLVEKKASVLCNK